MITKVQVDSRWQYVERDLHVVYQWVQEPEHECMCELMPNMARQIGTRVGIGVSIEVGLGGRVRST